MALPNGLPQNSDLGSLLGSLGSNLVDIPLINTPYTTVQNRAQMYDISKDLATYMGINRIPTQEIYEIQNEFGPSGQAVWGVSNDLYNQIRCVGNWAGGPIAGGQDGQGLSASTPGDFIEVTFYGTGLNLLTTRVQLAGTSWSVSVDNGSSTTVTAYTSSVSNVLTGRNTANNIVIPITSGLSLDLHTVRITCTSNTTGVILATGFEILNISSNIRVNQGTSWKNGQKLYNPSQLVTSYNSNFESGILGSRGGRVVVYQKSNGSIGKAVRPTNASSLNLTAADHTNEEIARTYHWREFGSGRTDDFSIFAPGGSASKNYTLDDGVTNLVGNGQVVPNSIGAGDSLGFGVDGTFFTFTFVGTGLDIIRESFAGSTDTSSVTIDGTSVGSLANSFTSTQVIQEKIVSGLPYGTHTVRLTRTAGGSAHIKLKQFVVYQPKKPTIPSDAVEIASYNIMADFSANTTPGTLTISTGVIRKNSAREMTYVNGTGGSVDWTIAFDLNSPSGWEFRTDRLNGYFQYTFFGTGFDFRFSSASNRSANISVTLNGVAATTANYPTLASSVYGTGVTFASGVLDMNDGSSTNGAGLVVRNLPLGLYTVRFNNNTGSANLINSAFDIITPIHSHKNNGPFSLQNSLSVGSTGINDNRTPPSQFRGKNVAEAFGVSVSPTTTSATFLPVPDLNVTVKTNGNSFLNINYHMTVTANGTVTPTATIYLNGNQIGREMGFSVPISGFWGVLSDNMKIPVSAGEHRVDIYWQTNGATATTVETRRSLLVEEE